MGSTHAATGAAAWLAGCGAAAYLGHDPGPYVVLVGTPLAAFGAVLNDIDCPSSSVARSLGWPTQNLIARPIAWFGKWLYSATGTRRDGRDGDGHRTITHTLVFSVLVFLGFGWAGERGGPWLPLAMIVFAAATALRALKVYGTKRVPLAAVAGFAAWYWPAPEGWWLGWAIAAGSLVHNLGDRQTDTGVPWLWPLKIRGRRWYKFRTSKWMRLTTGEDHGAEGVIRWCCGLISTVALVGLVYFRWPYAVEHAVDHVNQVLVALGS